MVTERPARTGDGTGGALPTLVGVAAGAGGRWRAPVGRIVAYGVYTAGSVFMLLPFFWLLSTSLKLTGQEFLLPPVWIPHPLAWSNYGEVLNQLPFFLYLRNTLFIAVTTTTFGVLTASLAGYGFGRVRFPGRGLLFGFCLSTLMVPYAVTMIPEFIIFRTVGWVNTFLPLIVTVSLGGGPFAIFLFRQYFMTLPLELDEAARVDGAGTFRIWWAILLPLSQPILATTAIFNFFAQWNDFLRPLIYLNSPDLRTLTLGLLAFQGEFTTDWNLLMAMSVLMILPIMIIFLAGQRYIVRGIVMTGLAGR
jgi:multiple sugar transport system permease protein